MKRILNHPTLFSWMLLLVTVSVFLSQIIGIGWEPAANTAFRRLLDRPDVAGLEVAFAVALIVCAWLSRSKPSWLSISIAVAALICAIYHLLVYLIGIEFLLLASAGGLMRHNFKREELSPA